MLNSFSTSLTSTSTSCFSLQMFTPIFIFKDKIILVGRFPGQRTKMERVRKCIFLSEMSTNISKSQIQIERKSSCAQSENFSAHLLSHLGPTSMRRVIIITLCPLIPLASKNSKGSYLFKMIFICSDFNATGFLVA